MAKGHEMTISILRLKYGQMVPRPFTRASNTNELAELLVADTIGLGVSRRCREDIATEARNNPGQFIRLDAIDTETPIYSWNGDHFYAFTEGR